jgi:hypothetical protein
MGIFNMPWGDDFVFPPPPPPGYQIPLPSPVLAAPLMPPAPGPAMPPLAAVRPDNIMFNHILWRGPDEQPHLSALEQDVDWQNFAGVPPLPEYRAAINSNPERAAALQDAMATRSRNRNRREDAVRNEVQPHNSFQNALQAAAAQQEALEQHPRQAQAREMGLPNVIFPEAPELVPRQALGVAVANAVATREACDAERRWRLEEQVGNVAVDPRIGRFMEIAQNKERREDERENRLRGQIGGIQALQNNIPALGHDRDENMHPHNERLERLRQRLGNQNGAKNEAGGPIEDGNIVRADAEPLLREKRLRPRRAEQSRAALPYPAAALRQQQILDHEERRIERLQLMAILRREQENDEAATAKNLANLRRNGASAAAPDPRQRQAQAVHLLSSSPEAEKNARLFDMIDEVDDVEEEMRTRYGRETGF